MRRLLCLAAAAAALLVAPAAARAAQPPPGVKVLAQHGFGDRHNSYAWAMGWFKGQLYVGTGRDVMCVEAATSQFYFEFTTFYKTNPAPHVHCPKDKYAMDLRAEIWRYTPWTGRWKMVYRSPADIPNPDEKGKFVARDIAFRGMRVMRDRHGRQALFVSGVTADEYLPALARSHPPRVLRTYDGIHYQAISPRLIVRRSGTFPDHRPIGYRGIQIFHGKMYILASTALTGDGAVFRVERPFSRRPRFVQVSPRSMHVFEMQVWNGHLYVGTGSFQTGYGVYKTRSTHRPYRFDPVVTDGAGMGPTMVSVVSMHPFQGHLYVGGVSWYSATQSKLPASELIRIAPDDSWQVVTGDPRPGPDGKLMLPISGLSAGFGNIFNSHLWRIADRDGRLYVGTLDWSWLLQDSASWSQGWTWAINEILGGQYGFDLWTSCDGVSWTPETRDAFGVDGYDFGVRTLTDGPGGVYIGSANHAFGTRIYRDAMPPCGGGSSARAAAVPRNLLATAARAGTVLSWRPAAGALAYRVERAQYTQRTLSFFPPAGEGGFPLEGAEPQPAPPGALGSVQVRAPVLGPFAVVGTTRAHRFVDRTRVRGVRYAYRVVAETTAGVAPIGSNVRIAG